ncbi:Putative pre-16S rRNA nuclease Yqg [hydrothermal vent metagenome]|uniref:Pre-16S rRNA nuclease Yqg n=1 Tax=hydrothermal vent metagenome TaxID=652676 RepID=A0A3B0S631_9ZZZZ
MPIIDSPQLPITGALLGLDPGTKTVGIAVSDSRRRIASGITTLRRSKFAKDAGEIFALYDDRNCSGMVIGLPVQMDGKEGPRAQSVRAFVRNLLQVRDIPVLLWDERLSTSAVERILIEADTRRDKRKTVIDKLAAIYILQGALDFLARQR